MVKEVKLGRLEDIGVWKHTDQSGKAYFVSEHFNVPDTVVIDQTSGRRYEFASRTACDRHFGWPLGTSATFLNSKRGVYKKRYRLIDAREEQRK